MRLLSGALLLIGASATAAPIPTRTPIGAFPIYPSKAVTHVETMRVDFLPGQEMPEHMHPVPVVCFVSKGTFQVSIGREPVRTVTSETRRSSMPARSCIIFGTCPPRIERSFTAPCWPVLMTSS
jgi:hypothetical protein